MKVELNLKDKMKITGINKQGFITNFDTVIDFGGDNSAATPMEVMLQSLGACSMMDVASIIRKKRKTINEFKVEIQAERAQEHPKVFTKVHLSYILYSPDAEDKDLVRAIELSQDLYCSASAMFKKSGCEVTFDYKIIK